MTTESSAMDLEFDVLAGWTLEAIERLGPDHALPAACRGTANPAMLAWLAEACELTTGQRLLDVGGGMGGPAAYAARHFGVRPVLVETMYQACLAARQLFGIAALAGSGARLPLPEASADVAWCLGVLCTTTEKPAVLAELRRVLRPGSALGLMVLTADQPHPPGAPEGNTFPGHAELKGLLDAARFTLIEELDATGMEAPLAWTGPAAAVDDLVRRLHGDDPRFAAAADQESRMADLFDSGRISVRLLHARAE